MSPACRIMLFTGSPLSINSFKFTVMVFDNAGGIVGTGASFAATSAEGKLGKGVTGAMPFTAWEGPIAELPEDGALLFDDDGGGITSCTDGGITSSLLTAGACEVSAGSEIGRVTMAVSPASDETPPASANTSSKVTGRSAWYTIGCGTAPTTVMGLLFLSLTETLTSGWLTKPLACNTSAIFCSACVSVSPLTCNRTGISGSPIVPVWLTRTSRLSSLTSNTSMLIVSPAPMT